MLLFGRTAGMVIMVTSTSVEMLELNRALSADMDGGSLMEWRDSKGDNASSVRRFKKMRER